MYGDLKMSYEAIKSPSLAQSQYNLVLVLIKQERWQEAVQACGQVIDLDPVFVPAYQTLGELLHQQGDWEAAIQCYQKAIDLKPEFAGFHHGLGLALGKLEKWTEAAKALSKATELNPDFSWSHNSLGEALLRLKKWDGAAKALRKAIKLNPDFAWSYFNLGEVLTQLQDWDGAVNAYKSASKLQSDLPNIQSKLGNALQQQSNADPQAALDCYLEGIKNNPDNEEAYLKALEIKANDAELYVQYGNALVEQNRTSEAIFAYYLAIQTQPNNIKFHLKLGKTLIAQGQIGHAIDCYRRALKFNPGAESIELALEKALVRKQKNLDGDNNNSIRGARVRNRSNFRGKLEPIKGIKVRGWALDNRDLNRKIIISVYEGNELLLQVKADKYRGDIHRLKKGDGYHGFMFELPEQVLDNRRHELDLYFEDSDIKMNQSPLIIEEDYVLKALVQKAHKNISSISDLANSLL